MKTIEIKQPVSAAAMYFGVLRSSRKRPQAITELPAITYVRPQVVLDARHIARYAKICGFSAVQGVPITYPQLLTFPLVMAFFVSPDCPWAAMGTVHLANRIVQHKYLHAGDALRVEVSTGRLLAHEKGQVFELDIKILRDRDLVWEATQSLLRLGVPQPAGAPFASDLKWDLPLSRQADFVAAGDIGRRYGRLSGDLNPIHLWSWSARLFGFRRAIAHGLWTQARALAALLPQAPVAQAQLAVEFKTPLYLPASASLWTARDSRDPRVQNVAFEVRNARGDKPHLRGRLSYQQDY